MKSLNNQIMESLNNSIMLFHLLHYSIVPLQYCIIYRISQKTKQKTETDLLFDHFCNKKTKK